MMLANAWQRAQYVLAAPHRPPNFFPSPREGAARAEAAVPTMPRRVLFLWADLRGLGRGLAMLVGRRTTMRERVQAGLSRARPQGKTLGRPKAAVRLSACWRCGRRV